MHIIMLNSDVESLLTNVPLDLTTKKYEVVVTYNMLFVHVCI